PSAQPAPAGARAIRSRPSGPSVRGERGSDGVAARVLAGGGSLVDGGAATGSWWAVAGATWSCSTTWWAAAGSCRPPDALGPLRRAALSLRVLLPGRSLAAG